jgi:hypothetical protein
MVNSTGNYSVTVTDANGCSSSALSNVTVNTPEVASISADGSTTFCQGGSVTLTASAGSSFAWSTGATTQSITVNSTGNYSVTVTDANGCNSSASSNVTVNTPATASISADGSTTFCQGGSVTLTASAGSTFAWSTGATTQSITVNSTGNYSVTVTDANGCNSSASSNVTVNANPTVDAGSYSALTTLSSPIALSGSPSGGLFSGIGVSGDTFNPSISGVGSFVITYSFTNANGCSASDQTTIEVTQGCNFSVSEITGPTNACPHIGTVGINAVYSVNAVDATSFTWTLPSGVTNISGQGTNSISFKFPSTFTSGNISVSVNGCAGTINRSIAVTRSIPAIPAAISGPANVCAFRGNGQEVAYSIAAVPSALSYTWTVPSNVQIVSGQGTTTLRVIIGSAFTSGTLTVRSNSGCGNSNTRSLALNSSIPGTPSTITGTSRACNGNVFTYSVPAVANATNYNWNTPTGTQVISGAGTNSVQIAFNAGFIATGTISVSASNGCGTSTARTYTVSRNNPGQPSSIVGQANGVCSSTQTYTVTNVAGMSYNWIAPANSFIISGQGTNSIAVEFATNFTTGTLSVNANNACGTSTNRTLALRAVPATPAAISGSNPACTGTVQTYTVSPIFGVSSYTWTVPASWAIQSGQGTNSITVLVGSGNGSITVRGVNSCGLGSTRSLSVTVTNCGRLAAMDQELSISVFPNPFSSSIQINTTGKVNEQLTLELIDITGRVISKQTIVANQSFEMSPDLSNGVYYLSITNNEYVRQSIRIVKAN